MEEKKEQQNTVSEPETPPSSEANNFFDTEVEKFKDSQPNPEADEAEKDFSLEFLFDLELHLSVELAWKQMPIREILQLGEGSIVEFDKLADENVDIYVNNKKIARGEVVVIDDRFGVRITNLVNPSERLLGITN